jgi:Trypsin-co-occurring domain 2
MTESESTGDGVGLADALEALRTALESARLKAAGTDLQFPITAVTVELKAVVTWTGEGRAGFKIPFFDAELGGSASRTSEHLQTITLTLGPPVDRHGEPVKVASISRTPKM